jgi:hypothetical protein
MVKMNEFEEKLFFETVREAGAEVENGREYSWLAKNIGTKAVNTTYTDVCAIITHGA